MLISFTVSNFRSIGEEATLTMIASNKITRHPEHRIQIGNTGQSVLRTAVIYGANAAGKSNLVKAMGLGQRMILNRGDRIRQVDPFGSLEYASKPSMIEFRFMIGDRVFIYGFDVLVNRVQGEWFAVMDGDNEVIVFERGEAGETIINKDASGLFPSDQMLDTLTKLKELPSRKEQLFLNRALDVPDDFLGETLKSVIDWFAKDLIVLPPGSRTGDLLDRLAADPRLMEFCATFLRNVGTGIGHLLFNERKRPMRDWERPWLEQYVKYGRPAYPYPYGGDADTDVRPIPDDPTSVMERQLVAAHPAPGSDFALPFSAESDGTQALLHLLPTIASSPSESRVLVLDELDRSLHPMLTWEFIRFFSESCEGARKQLIATTHESYLLNQELLRRDEYWFAEKDDRQQTHIYSLADFSLRNDLKLQKGYLQGRFGAIPVVGGMQALENLLECTSTGEEINAKEETSA